MEYVACCCSQHLAPAYGAFPYPKDLFLKFVRENNGYFPVKLEALPEGTCVHARVPVYQVGCCEAAAGGAAAAAARNA